MSTVLLASYAVEIVLLLAVIVVLVAMSTKSYKAKKACRIFRERPTSDLWLSLFDLSSPSGKGNGHDKSPEAIVMLQKEVYGDKSSEEYSWFLTGTGG